MTHFLNRRPENVSKFLRLMGRAGGNHSLELELAMAEPGTTIAAAAIQKAQAASFGNSTWGDELSGLGTIRREFLSTVMPQTVLGKIGRPVPGRTRIFNLGSGAASAWTGEAHSTDVSELTLGESSVPLYKLTSLLLSTRDLLESTTSDAEAFILDGLAAEAAKSIDSTLLDPGNTGSPGVMPESITLGAPTISATGNFASDAGVAALRSDVRRLFNSYSGNWDRTVLIGNTRTICSLAMAQVLFGAEDRILVVTGGSVPGDASSPATDMLILVDRDSLRYATPDLVIDVSSQGDIVLSGAGSSATGPTPKTMTSLFQTRAVAFKATVTTGWSTPPAGLISVLTGIPRE